MKVVWGELPEAVRASMSHHVGPIAAAEQILDGQSSDVTCVLRDGDGGSVFLKGVRGRSPAMRWLRNETVAARHAAGIAPALLFVEDVHVDGEDWLLVGFEYVPGRPADLAPGSPDLELVGATVERIAARPALELRSLRERWPATDWWRQLAITQPDTVVGLDPAQLDTLAAEVPALVDGDRLVHTDLHGDQYLIDGHSARVIDWGMPGRGAAWVDTAYMVLRLIEAGHCAEGAEGWARARTTWSVEAEAALTSWSAYLAGMWTSWVPQGRSTVARAALARRYLADRLRAAGCSGEGGQQPGCGGLGRPLC